MLERLVAAWHETAVLAVATEVDVVYIDKVVSDQFGFRTDPRVNARRPLHSHSLGKALLAATGDRFAELLIGRRGLEPVTPHTIVDPAELLEDLRRTRERGFAMDQQEAVLGVCCVGAPSRPHRTAGRGDQPLDDPRVLPARVTGPAVHEGAFQISRAMGWSGHLKSMYAAGPGPPDLFGDAVVPRTPALAQT